MHAAFQTVTFETADFAIHEQRVKRFSGIPTGWWGEGARASRKRRTPGERVQRGPFNQYHVSRMHRATLDHAIQLFCSSRRGPNAVRGGNKTSGLVYATSARCSQQETLRSLFLITSVSSHLAESPPPHLI